MTSLQSNGGLLSGLATIVLTLAACFSTSGKLLAANPYDNADTLYVAQDGTAEFTRVADAIEVCRAFMDYHKVIFVKKGVYHEKIVIPSWLQNIEICGQNRDQTIITNADHANIHTPEYPNGIGTFRTYTLKIEGNDITLKNITIENPAPRLGQSVALHTEGDRLTFINCRFLGNQDTVYTGLEGTRLFFSKCYIEGTTDFIFGPSTAWFEDCDIFCKTNSYITAASTPRHIDYGYIFNRCRIAVAEGVTGEYLGRPWRDYAYTLFMHCSLPKEIKPEGWHQWRPEAPGRCRYYEYENEGPGADIKGRVAWSRQLTKKEAKDITIEKVFARADNWQPAY